MNNSKKITINKYIFNNNLLINYYSKYLVLYRI